MTVTIEKRDGTDWVVHSDLDGWARPATPDESALWAHKDARIAELDHELSQCASSVECRTARILELEKALRSVRTELENNAGLRNEYQEWSNTFAIIDTALAEE